MRDKNILVNVFEDIKLLYQYLYLDAEHRVEVSTVTGSTLSIRMTDNCEFYASNSDFPNLPEMCYTTEMSLNTVYSIIESLKKQPAKDFPNKFDNRWEEIKELTKINVCLNM